MAVSIHPDYIDAAHDMYKKYRVVSGICAVDTLDYNDPITGNNIYLDIFWRMKDTPSGPAEVWSVVLPRSNAEPDDFINIDEIIESDVVGDNEIGNDLNTKWNIYFQAYSGIIINAKTKNDLNDAIVNCRECLEQIVKTNPFIA